jgi:uncharacterized protein (DUF1697 family)
MTVYISILRGINVSGQKSIKMTELKALYESMGFEEVSTYIQSGNLVFRTAKKPASDTLHQAIKDRFGFDVPVILRSATEWKKVTNSNPFIKDKNKDVTKMHVVFLAEKPDKSTAEKLNSYRHEPEAFNIQGKEIFLYCPNGYGKTKLSNNNIEKATNTCATTRNWKTVNKLLEIANSL